MRNVRTFARFLKETCDFWWLHVEIGAPDTKQNFALWLISVVLNKLSARL